MARKNPWRPFSPDSAQAALRPAVSGDDINGVGETAPRRARVVYWAENPDSIPHGALQRWFYSVRPDEPELRAAREARARLLQEPMPEVSGPPARRPPRDWTAALDAFVAAGDCEMTGVAEMREEWLYEGVEARWSRLIVLAVAHDFSAISAAPLPRAGAEVVRQYGRAAAAAKKIAGWLRRQGWPAEPVTGPLTGEVLLIPPAIACGFGELGKHGSLINAELGASFRLAGIFCDAPFAPTPRREFGVDSFCAACRVCEDACPPEAIAPEKRMVRGIEKWQVDFDRCLPFFNETHGCAMCIAACPWSRPGAGLNLAAKLARRAERLAAQAG